MDNNLKLNASARSLAKTNRVTDSSVFHPTAGMRWAGHVSKLISLTIALSLLSSSAAATVAGNGTKSEEVRVADNGGGTLTMSNGIVSIVIVKSTSRLDSVTYTHGEGEKKSTSQMLKGKGQYYYGGFMLGSGNYVYSLATDPASNGGDYGDVKLLSDSPTNGVMETHFSMLRGSHGFYSTAIMTHRLGDAAFEVGAWGVVTRVAPNFNWLSADAKRNLLIGTPTTTGRKVPNAPHEATVNLDGSQAGEFADKFVFGQDHADFDAWGWSSVGNEGMNVGIWMMTNMEFSDGGPLKRDVTAYPYSELNNSILTGELGMGSDGHLAAGEVWTKTCGPWFTYMNDVPPTVTGAAEAAQLLYDDALARSRVERSAWPYSWFKNPKFVPGSGRGTVEGKITIRDTGNPNASSASVWVGLEEQPLTNTGTHDFQKWLKPYQFWTQTDASGSFKIPNVLPGDHYTLWAYGSGAPGTFVSQNQKGGNPPLECDLPATAFAVTVKPGETTKLGTIEWRPKRVGATVFELGVPDRKAGEFRHGEDFWSPDKSPKLGYPTPVWGAQMLYPTDFPNGVIYTVGQSRWTTDWNYVLPSLPDAAGLYQPCTATINFDLAKTPDDGTIASIYLGCAGDDGGHVVLSVNGVDLASAANVTAEPNPMNPNDVNRRNGGIGGFNPFYSDDSSIHYGDHGPFSDERITFPGKMLHAGRNAIAITKNARAMTAYLMVDYLRLELAGYVPPAPASVTAYAGNGRALVCWPVVAGANSYNLLRSKSSGSGFAEIESGLVGTVCGSGPRMMTYVDATAGNNAACFYAVQSVNSVGHSERSAPSDAVTPSLKIEANARAAPSDLRVVRSGHHAVELRWGAAAGANFYGVWRTTMYENGAGGMYPLRTILLDDAVLGTGYTDTSPTDGKIYNYYVTASNAAGTSGPSARAKATPLPSSPSSAPGSLVGSWTKTRHGPGITLRWSPVPGAVGYVIYRSSQPNGQFHFPEDFLTTLMETTYTDENSDKKEARKTADPLVSGKDYQYQVTAVNAAGVSAPAVVVVNRD